MMIRPILLATLLTSVQHPAAAETSFQVLYDQLVGAAKKACAGRDDCLRTVTSFGWFLWNNRDKTDITFNTSKCLGFAAYNRGYLWSPSKMLDDLTPAQSIALGIEVCDCVIGYWGKEPLCRTALTKGDFEALADLAN